MRLGLGLGLGLGLSILTFPKISRRIHLALHGLEMAILGKKEQATLDKETKDTGRVKDDPKNRKPLGGTRQDKTATRRDEQSKPQDMTTTKQ